MVDTHHYTLDSAQIDGPAQPVGKGLISADAPYGSPEKIAKYLLQGMIEHGMPDELSADTHVICLKLSHLPDLAGVHPGAVMQGAAMLGVAIQSILSGKASPEYNAPAGCHIVPPNNNYISLSYSSKLDSDKVIDDLIEHQSEIESSIDKTLELCKSLAGKRILGIGHG